MRLKLFGNGAMSEVTLEILNGAYDADIGKVVLIVRNKSASGLLTFDINEARQVDALSVNLPTVEKIDGATLKVVPPNDVV